MVAKIMIFFNNLKRICDKQKMLPNQELFGAVNRVLCAGICVIVLSVDN